MGGQGSGRKTPARIEFAPNLEIWDRQPIESDVAWLGFVTYRDMGLGRTIARATETLGKKPGYAKTMEAWSRNYAWRQRVEAYDSHLDQQRREAIVEEKRQEAKDMVRRHLSFSNTMQRLVSVELTRWINKVGANLDKPDLDKDPELSPEQLQKLLDQAVKLERLNRGEPESVTETRTKTDDVAKGLSRLTTEELKTMRAIKAKMEAPDN